MLHSAPSRSTTGKIQPQGQKITRLASFGGNSYFAVVDGGRGAGQDAAGHQLAGAWPILAATGLTSREIVELQKLLDRATANLDGFNPLDDGAGE